MSGDFADFAAFAEGSGDRLLRETVQFLRQQGGLDGGGETTSERRADPGHGLPGPFVCLADVKPEEPGWLWPGRIPLGAITALTGPRGAGKSLVALDLAARVSRGAPWPDAPGVEQPAGSVLLITAEDTLAGTVVPRLIAAGADLAGVHAVEFGKPKWDDGRLFRLTQVGRIEEALDALPDLRLVIVDPFAAVAADSNDRRTLQLSDLLTALAGFAARRRVAVVLVNASDAISSGKTWHFAADVRPFVDGVARASWSVEADPDDPTRRLLLPARVMMGPEPCGLRFAIDREAGRVAWESEPIALRAEPTKAAARAVSDVARASHWLRARLADGPEEAAQLLREGSEAGHTRRALYAAKERLGACSSKASDGFAGRWSWRLPGQEPGPDPPGEEAGAVRRFEDHAPG